MLFKNREDAGRRLAELLSDIKSLDQTVVLGLPRGGVPVAYEVSRELNTPLDVFIVRKLGVPGQEELAMGALASGGIRILNTEVVKSLAIPENVIDEITEKEKRELKRQEEYYNSGRNLDRLLKNATVILIDDGLATGASMRAAVAAIKEFEPQQIIAAVPVAAPETCRTVEQEVDRMVCVQTPEKFRGVGYWYEDFSQVSDREVRDLLNRSHENS